MRTAIESVADPASGLLAQALGYLRLDTQVTRDRLRAIAHCLLNMYEAERRGRWDDHETWRLGLAALTGP